jgi:Reverse transcriptase (RNA-dependent DNA polymerase)
MASPEEPLYCCKVDLTKAYDKVPPELLWEAMHRLGIQGTFLEAMKSIYDDAGVASAIGGTYGKRNRTEVGILPFLVPQHLGSTLTVLFFILDNHVRMLVHALVVEFLRRHVPIIGFADDFKLLARTPRRSKYPFRCYLEMGFNGADGG